MGQILEQKKPRDERGEVGGGEVGTEKERGSESGGEFGGLVFSSSHDALVWV